MSKHKLRELIGVRDVLTDALVPVEAVAIRSGLAVHKTHRIVPGLDPWVVTHIESGKSVHRYPTCEAALRALGRLTMFLDWEGTQEEVLASEVHCTAGTAERNRVDL